jgi:creatinine amidohydrolase
VPEGAFEKILEYAARTFRLHGSKEIVLFSDHGAYQANEKNVGNSLTRDRPL